MSSKTNMSKLWFIFSIIILIIGILLNCNIHIFGDFDIISEFTISDITVLMPLKSFIFDFIGDNTLFSIIWFNLICNICFGIFIYLPFNLFYWVKGVFR